jgi:hypothetical protein
MVQPDSVPLSFEPKYLFRWPEGSLLVGQTTFLMFLIV